MTRRPPEESHDLDRTDTLPMLVLAPEGDDTGTLAVPHLPPLEPSWRAAEDLLSATDSFTAATLATPIAAIPVGVPDLAENLREREGRLAETSRRVEELEAQLAGAEQHRKDLDARLAEAVGRCVELEQQCAALREALSRAGSAPAAPAAPPILLDEVAALRRSNALLHESISSLHGRLGVHEAMLAEAEEALRAAEATVPVAPAPEAVQPGAAAASPPGHAQAPLLVDWPARYAELEIMLEAERATAAGRLGEQAVRLSSLQAEIEALRASSLAATPGAVPAAAATPPAPAYGTEPVVRVLIRTENGMQSIYPLGRHTTIGRTPDNDIQVDTTYVSRHHAVLLAGAGECIVEDLNSTNGLLVNGHRVGRQVLQHGDSLTVGRTHFTYETRP